MAEGKQVILKTKRRHLLLALVTVLVGFLFVFWIWQSYLKGQREILQHEIELSGHYTALKFEKVIQDNIESLENLGARIEVTSGGYFNYWEHDARRIIRQNPSFRFVEWIDSNMVIRKIEPLEGNEPALNLDISTVEYRRNEWIKHTADSVTNITEWAEMTQGDNAFLVDVPIYYGGRFQGTITAGMDFRERFNQMLAGMEKYAVVVRDEQGTPFYSYNNPNPGAIPPEFIYKHPIQFSAGQDRAHAWSFSYLPKPKLLQQQSYTKGILGLIMGLLISILIGIVVYYFNRSRYEARRIREVNKKLKKLNVAFDRERKKADKASQSKTEFLSNMSHEIRTPLNALVGFIEIMKQMEMGEDQLKYLRMMDFSSKNLLSLVNDILEIDKIESGRLELRQEVFSPSEEIRNLVSVFGSGFQQKKLELKLNEETDDHRKVMGDEGKFNQVITNLLRNAFKFTQKGYVEVNYTEDLKGDQVQIWVEVNDTGIGIPKEKMKVIFDRFSQVDSSIRRRHEGSGLGLAITYQLVKMMGGSISVESEPGRGSSFSVQLTLPIVAQPQAINGHQDDTLLPAFAGKKVLIVEDNAMNVMVLNKVLEQMKVTADVANNGVEALEKVEGTVYDLVFMDIHMPEMDGFEATRTLRERQNQVTVIGLSANVTREAINESVDAGMADYLTKPFSRQKLLEILRKYLS